MSMRRFCSLAAAFALAATVVSGIASPSSAAPEAAPALVADYRFDNRLTSAVPGAPPLHHINHAATDNTFATENVDGVSRRVLQFPEGNGLLVTNLHRILRPASYTIAVRMRFDAVNGYRRVLNYKSFGSARSDTGVYVRDNDLVFYDRAFPTTDSIDADEWVTVVVTRAKNRTLRAYVDGEQQFGFVDRLNRAVIDGSDGLRFFRDDSSGEMSSGSVARIRIWDGPMTPAQVAALPG